VMVSRTSIVRVPGGTVPEVLRKNTPVRFMRSAGVTGPILAVEIAALAASLNVTLRTALSESSSQPPRYPLSENTAPASMRAAAEDRSIDCDALDIALLKPPAK